MEESTRMPNAPRVAMTLTQDWHRVPGGTAVAANALARALCETGDVSLTGVGPAGPPPGEPWNPPVDTRALRLRLPWLYEAWDRLRRPRVTSAVPDAELVHLTVPIACPPERVPMVATVHDVLPLTMPEMFSRRGVRLMRRGLERIRDEAADHADDVVAGDKEANVVTHSWGEKPEFGFDVRDHVELATSGSNL